MKVLFLDESGNHSLNRKQLQGGYPVFVLGGVIVDRAYVRDVIEPEMNQFKESYFGRTDIILHTVEMNDGTGDFAFLANEETRTNFYRDLHDQLDRWDYQVIACAVKKRELVETFGDDAADPYKYSLHTLIETFCQELGDDLDAGFICAEKRGGSLDRELMLEWEAIRTGGLAAIAAGTIDCRIVGLDLRDKKPNLAGMQLADLVITPIGRHVQGMAAKPNRVQWEVVERKLRRVGGTYEGNGLVLFPP